MIEFNREKSMETYDHLCAFYDVFRDLAEFVRDDDREYNIIIFYNKNIDTATTVVSGRNVIK